SRRTTSSDGTPTGLLRDARRYGRPGETKMLETMTGRPARAREKIIDADVHPWVNGDIQGLKKYLSRDWWAHFDGRYTLPNHWLRPPLARASSNRIDAMTPSGGE